VTRVTIRILALPLQPEISYKTKLLWVEKFWEDSVNLSRNDGLRNCNCDCATSWSDRGSNPGKGQRFYGSSNHPGRICWGPHTILFNGYRSSFPGVKHPGYMLNTHLHLGPRLRLSGAIPVFLIYAFLAWTGITLTLFSLKHPLW
jgi:hypothetical protein